MITEKTIKGLIEEAIAGTDMFIVDIEVAAGNKIRVFMDADTAVTVENCAKINRFIEQHLDREIEDFDLEVSSAGLDKPLRLLRQYKKCLGKEIGIVLFDGQKQTGLLTSATEEEIKIEIIKIKKIKNQVKKEKLAEVLSIPFKQIKETKQVISF